MIMNIFCRILFYYKKLGFLFFCSFFFHKFFNFPISFFKRNKLYLKNAKSLEIGGPSMYFEPDGIFPIYSIVDDLDCVNFNSKTLWEGDILTDKFHFCNHSKTGKQFILDAVDLSILKSNSYDLVISCNNLEHIANPIKAIQSWINVLKENGRLIVIVPNNLINFDHKRMSTPFDHILTDFNLNIDETDLTHVEEILNLHDLKLDPLAGSFSDFEKRCYDNYQNRAIHHHVFDKNLLFDIFNFLSIKIIDFQETPNDFFIIGMKQF